MDSQEQRMDSQDQHMDSMERHLGNVEADVKSVRVTLETFTNKKIDIIAEGHLDLDRKLTYIAETNSMRENEIIRITSLESDVKYLKDQMKKVIIA